MTDDKKDLTRIQDLSEFLHEDDPDAEEILNLNLDPADDEENHGGEDLDSLEDYQSDESSDEYSSEDSTFEAEQDENQWDSDSDSELNTEFETDENPLDDSEENTFESDQFESEESDFADGFESDYDAEEDTNSFEDSEGPEVYEEIIEEPPTEVPVANDSPTSNTFQAPVNNDYVPPTKTEKEILDSTRNINRSELVASKVENELDNLRNAPATRESDGLTNELRQFGENYTYNSVKSSGNPAYSILVTEIPSQHHEDIIMHLREFQITGDDDLYRQSLEENMVLISHIGEFAAISLANKFSRYGAKVKLAPSEILHESPHYENESQLTHSASSINSSIEDDVEIDSSFKAGNIIITTTSFLQGHKIHKYLGLVQDFVVLSTSELHDLINAKESSEREIKDVIDQEFFNKNLLIHEFHDKLQRSLEHQARAKKGNAIVGLQYSYTNPSRNTYEITCTGTVVYALRIKDKPFYE